MRVFALLVMLLSYAPTALAADAYSEDTVWDYASHAEDVARSCGVASWFLLQPEDSIRDQGCIIAAMRQLGASESAVRFLVSTGQFLAEFDERGAIDFGHASVPWINMGRGEAVILNAVPSAILMSRVLDPRPDAWSGVPGYAELLQDFPQLSPWVEYGGPISLQQTPDGGYKVLAAFSMREFRAGPNVASMPIVFTFSGSGVLTGQEVMSPSRGAP
jgi:hypothetical protein